RRLDVLVAPLFRVHTDTMFIDWIGSPVDPEIEENGVTFGAKGKTDYFRDPASETVMGNAPFYWREAPEAFTLTVRVRPEFRSTYDAGSILYYADEADWAKLAYELTDMDYPAIVSVVTRGSSDDCNGEPWSAGSVWLRVSRNAGTLGLYYGADGKSWKMHRLLSVPGQELSHGLVGLSVQAPTGNGCRTRFDHLGWSEKPVRNFRTGI
ncbi:MAG: DUF1349 domain-containing protein, partial [Spirochaetaceae bacterium]